MSATKTAYDLHGAVRTNCPMCGHPLDRFEQALAQNDSNFQCRHCWTCIGHGSGNGKNDTRTADGHRR